MSGVEKILEPAAADVLKQLHSLGVAGTDPANVALFTSIAISLRRIADAMAKDDPDTLKGGVPYAKVFASLTQWCEWCAHDDGNKCRLRDTRYDNCRCEQMANSVLKLKP